MMQTELGQSTSAIRNQLDVAALEKYMTSHLHGTKGPIEVKQFKLGQSNPTYLITDAASNRYVLRKKPAGKLLSATAHAVEREYKVLAALASSGKKIPVPKVYALCEEASVLGTPFYIMEFVEGRILSDVTFAKMSPEHRRKCWFSVIDALAEIHTVDFRAVGLEGFGRPEGFYSRQISSLRKVSGAQAVVRNKETNKAVGELPRLEEMLRWFDRNQAEDATAIIHGDFKIDNMVFHPTEPRVIGILDWELSTIGHPLSDLANLLQPFYIPTELSDLPGLKGHKSLPPGMPTDQELLNAYCMMTGRFAISHWEFCIAFSFFRLAVITQGIAARVAMGNASSAEARTFARLFVPMTELALEYVDAGDLELPGAPPNHRASKI